MRKIFCSLIIVFAVVIFITTPVSAEETDNASEPTGSTVPLREIKKNIIEHRQDVKKEILNEKQEMRVAIKNEKEEVKNKITDLHLEIKKKQDELKAEFKQKRDEFKSELKTIKDEKKKTIVGRVDEHLTTINKNRTEQFTQVIEKLNEILNKIIAKKDELEASGVDVAAIEAAITEAETAIDTAENAVIAQGAKEYIAEITDEATLGVTISTVVTQLRSDLKTVHQSIIDAKNAVRKAATELAKTKHNNPITPSAATPTSNSTSTITPTAQITAT